VLRVDDWGGLLELAGKPGLAGKLLKLKDEKGTLESSQKEYQRLHAEVTKVREELKNKNLEAEKVKLLQKQLSAATMAETDFLDRKWPTASESLKSLIESALRTAARDSGLFTKHPDLQGKDGSEGPPLRPPGRQLQTAYDKVELERRRLGVLTRQFFPGIVQTSYQVNYVDPRLATPKTWRDVYDYDAKGNYLGWTRYDGKNVTPFNPDGFIVLEKDKLGRCSKARTVQYVQDAPTGKVGPNWSSLRHVLGDEIVAYEYAGDDDFRGKIKSRQAPEK
jgi:hypothetical protein